MSRPGEDIVIAPSDRTRLLKLIDAGFAEREVGTGVGSGSISDMLRSELTNSL